MSGFQRRQQIIWCPLLFQISLMFGCSFYGLPVLFSSRNPKTKIMLRCFYALISDMMWCHIDNKDTTNNMAKQCKVYFQNQKCSCSDWVKPQAHILCCAPLLQIISVTPMIFILTDSGRRSTFTWSPSSKPSGTLFCINRGMLRFRFLSDGEPFCHCSSCLRESTSKS